MRINEKTLHAFATSKPVDKEGYLSKRGEVNKSFQRRWFVLKGNLLFYFEKRGGELLGMIILEGCVIELAEAETEKYCFNINFHGNRTYILSADDQDTLESWMKALTMSGYDYLRLMISELQRQLEEIDKTSSETESFAPPVPPTRRQNPFNKFNEGEAMPLNNQHVTLNNSVVLRPAPLPPLEFGRNVLPENFNTVRFDFVRDDNEFLMFEPERDDLTFEKIHEEFGRPILLAMSERKILKEKAEAPLILL